VRAAYAVVPNGIDLDRFSPAPSAGSSPAPRAAGGGPLAVCVGRLCRQKGQEVLLRAWDEVRRAVPGARLTLVGDGPDREVLRRRADPSVHFAGAVADPVPWYRAADLVVLPSRWEGMALAPLEALGCGRPVVVTDVGGARESLPPALAARCLVPPEDPAALAGAVAQLLSDPPLCAALGAQGRRHVLSAHDVRHTAGRVAALYRELLGARTLLPSECRESIHS
jgi:glycosyltransferase involved in cell wall biosynthesis